MLQAPTQRIATHPSALLMEQIEDIMLAFDTPSIPLWQG